MKNKNITPNQNIYKKVTNILSFRKISIFVSIFLYVFAVSNLTAKDKKQSLLWKVEDTKTKNYSYILGSIHLGKKSMYPLSDFVENAYKESSSLVLEIDISKVNPMEMMKLMMFSDTTTLKSQITAETYTKLKKIFEENGLPEMMFIKFKPWAAILTSQQLMMKGQLDEEIAPGIDVYFMEKAGKDNKEIEQLETIEFQMGLFEEFNSIANEYIEYSLEQLEDETELDNMIKAYINSDTKALNDLINKSKEEFPDYEKILNKILYERNINMTKSIENWITKDKKVRFIVVGAGHLVGDKSIIQLLEKNKSLKVTNVVK